MPLTNAEILDFHRRLREFVMAERDANRAELHNTWRRPVADRIGRGWAIRDLTVTQIERLSGSPEVLITLKCERDESRFREGDYVKLTYDQPLDPGETLASGRIVSSDEGWLVLAAEKCRLQEGETGLVLDAGLIDLTDRYEKALDAMLATEHGRKRVIPLLLNRIEPRASHCDIPTNVLRAEGLNEKQIEALVCAASTDLCHLIQGPPGTGKTKVLARLVRQLLAQKPDASILVTSFTHRAIDHALEAVIESKVNRAMVVKISAHPPDGNIPHAFNAADPPFANRGGPIVIGATPFVLAKRAANVEFDWVIVDEASQMTLPLAVMAMVAGKRWIFFGDHKQMPPVVQSIPPEEAIRASVFGVLQQGGYTTTLTTTYRLNDTNARWPSATFYRGALRPEAVNAGRRLRLPVVPRGFEGILGPDPAAVFVQCNHRRSTTSAPEEIEAAARIVAALDGVSFPLSEIGIVVPYRLQARGIKQALARGHISRERRAALVADTVERMQGQERDVVIVSLTTSSVAFVEQIADFLLRPERLNVAITRPKSKLIVLGSSAWLEEIPDRVPAARLVSEFLRTCALTTMPPAAHG